MEQAQTHTRGVLLIAGCGRDTGLQDENERKGGSEEGVGEGVREQGPCCKARRQR